MPHLFRSVFHPTAFSGSRDAFAHALRIAVSARGELRLLHVNAPREAPDFDPFPRAREMLAQWGMIARDATQDDMRDELGLRVVKNLVWDANPRGAILGALQAAPPDIVVLSVADRAGLPDLFQDSVAEEVARASGRIALCVRRGAGGFVSEETGAVTLKSILVPVSDKVRSASAIDAALSLCDQLGARGPQIHLLSVGPAAPAPPEYAPAGAQFHLHRAQGPVVDAIVAAQARLSADLLCMPIARRRSLVASVVGGVSQRVLRGAPCPVLLAPAG